VIEAQVHFAWARKARVAFYVTAIVVTLLTMSVAADRLHPIVALLLGLAVGVAVGLVAWAIVRAWPVIRMLWWWTPEIAAAAVTVYGWAALARGTILPVRLAVVAVLVGVPAAVPLLRRRITAVAWCFIVRHRLRTCFAQFIIGGRSGSLPLILWARPTPVGERVWLFLRTGLSMADLTNRLEKIAVACWADQVTIERASDSQAGFLRVDVKRRPVLKAEVESPLPGLVDPNTPTPMRPVTEVPTALDLPQVIEPDPTLWGKPAPVTKSANGSASSSRKPAPTPAAPGSASAGDDSDDVNQWI